MGSLLEKAKQKLEEQVIDLEDEYGENSGEQYDIGSEIEKKEKELIKIEKEIKKSKKASTKRTPSKPAKLVVPEHIKILFNNLDKSINSVWGVQKDGKIKWDAKYNMWLVFKEYFKELI